MKPKDDDLRFICPHCRRDIGVMIDRLKEERQQTAQEIFKELESLFCVGLNSNEGWLLVNNEEYKEIKQKYLGDKRMTAKSEDKQPRCEHCNHYLSWHYNQDMECEAVSKKSGACGCVLE